MERQSYVAALVGAGVGPSLTPPMHEREGAWQGVNYVYRTVDIETLELLPESVTDTVDSARKLGFNGLNITHPCKQLVLEHLDSFSADAVALGAVNTVVFRGGETVGYNTDKSGFVQGFRLGLPNVPLGHVVLLGAGGAGAAVGHALLDMGAERVDVFDLDGRRAGELVASLHAAFDNTRARASAISDHERLRASLAKADGLVHATPTGMAAHPGIPVPAETLRPELWVAEVVYRPLETELLRAARERGCAVLDGGRMAVFQAADAFALFTGIEPDTARMLSHFNELIANPADGRVADHVHE